MPILVSALGLYYVIGAALVLWQVRLEWLFDRAIDMLADGREPDSIRSYFMAAAAVLYGAAGLALLLRSSLAVWLLGSGLMLQAGYYSALWLLIGPETCADDDRWRKAWSAAMVSAGAFAFSAYAMRTGILI